MGSTKHFAGFARLAGCAALAFAAIPFTAGAEAPKVGAPAPAFNATDSHGKAESLDQFKGKYVVLEWHNQGCPYTIKHYASGNMQNLQKTWTAKGVVWLTVISSAPGQQGYVNANQENDYMAKMHATPTAALLDPDGKLGHLFDAKTTPHMFIIDPAGKLVYEGAIDSIESPDQSDIKGADNYVNDALTAALAGKSIAVNHTRPYGCSVKYAN